MFVFTDRVLLSCLFPPKLRDTVFVLQNLLPQPRPLLRRQVRFSTSSDPFIVTIYMLVNTFERECQEGKGAVGTKLIDCVWNGLAFRFELTQQSSYIITTLA